MNKLIWILLIAGMIGCHGQAVLACENSLTTSELELIESKLIELKECEMKVSTFQTKEYALDVCEAKLEKSQERFFKMNKTWIKGVVSGIALVLLLL